MSTNNNIEKISTDSTNYQNASIAELFMSNPVELILSAARQIQPVIERQSKQINDLRTENESLRISNAEENSRLKVENQNLTIKLDSSNKELTDKKDEILKLVESNTRFEMENQDLTIKLDSANKELTEKKDKIFNLTESLKTEESLKNDLEKQLKDSQKENDTLKADINKKDSRIEELGRAEKDYQKQIVDFESGRDAMFTSMIKQLNFSVELCIQKIDGKWCDYLKPIIVEIPDDEARIPEVVKRMVVAEKSSLCRLVSIRWWSSLPELNQKMKDMFDVGLLTCLTDIIVDLVRQYGFVILTPNGTFCSDISDTGYKPYQGAFSIARELFPESELLTGKTIYSEVIKLSYSNNEKSIVGEIAYTR